MVIIRDKILGVAKNSIKKNKNKVKEITKSSFEINKSMIERDKSETNNIIAILLDDRLSLATRLLRAGRSPASSVMVKAFKKNIIKHIKNHKKKLLLVNSKNNYLKGILNLKLYDLELTSFLQKVIKASVKEAAKKEIKVLIPLKTVETKKNNVTKKEVITDKKKVQISKNESVLIKTVEKVVETKIEKNIDKVSRKTTELSKLNVFTSLKVISFTEELVFEKSSKISQVKLLEENRRNKINGKDLGRTMPISLEKN